MATATDYIERYKLAYERGLQAQVEHQGAYYPELEKYPVDTREILQVVCSLFYLRPPETKKSKGYWVQSARELLDACGEFGVDVVREYRDDYERAMDANRQKIGQGIAPHTVEGPNSLVKMCRDKARQMREKYSTRGSDYLPGGSCYICPRCNRKPCKCEVWDTCLSCDVPTDDWGVCPKCGKVAYAED